MPNTTSPLKKTPRSTMEKSLIDLTGQGGLYARFYGDYLYNTGHPELAMFGAPEQYAGGIVNPIAKMGYMSPANKTYTTCVSTAIASDGIVTATIVDETNQFPLLYTASGVLHRAESLIDISFPATSVSISNTAGTDLSFYSVSGIRKLFFAYSNGTLGSAPNGDIGIWDLSGVSGGGVNGNTYFIAYSSLSSKFTTGETLTGSLSGATAHISGNYNINHDGTGATGVLYLTTITGTFSDGEIITDNNGTPGSATTHMSGTGGLASCVIPNFMSRYVATPATTDGVLPLSLTSGGFTRLIVADNGYMYILDGSSVHKYDGTDGGGAATLNVSGPILDSYQAFGIITPDVLEFPVQFTLTDAIDLRGNLWITLVRTHKNIYPTTPPAAIYDLYNGVYIWDRETEGTSTTDFIEVYGCREIRAIVSFQGVATLFTVSSTGYAQIRMWNGSDFKVVTQLGQSSYPEFHDSISVNGDLMVWLGADGQFYSYGKINPSVKSNALYQIGDTTVNVTNSSALIYGGAILLANGNQGSSAGSNQQPEGYYFGLLDTVNAKILKWFPHSTNVNSTNQQAATGNFFSMVTPLPKLSQTQYLTIFYPPIGSGGGTTVMNLNIYLNQSTTAWNASPITVTQDDALRGYKTIPVNVHGVNFFQVGWTYPASTSISLIPTPSFATIDYTPTTQIL